MTIIKPLWDESASYSTVKKSTEFRIVRESVEDYDPAGCPKKRL